MQTRTTHTTAGLRSGGPRRALAALLPLAALVALVVGQAVAFASGPGPQASLTLTPTSGPAGTHISVSGSSFGAGDSVTFGYTSGDCSTATPIAGSDTKAGADGTFTVVIVWPSIANGKYFLCAKDTTNGSSYKSGTPFESLGQDAPSISVSGSVAPSAKVTVTGKNFLPGGGTVEVLYGPAGSNGCATSATTATVGADGTFTATFNAPYETADTTLPLKAVEPQGSCGKNPVLEAGTDLKVAVAVAATPTSAPATATATTAPVAPTTGTGTGGLVWPPSWPPSGPWTVVYCLVGLLLLLLLLLLFLLLARRRKKEEPVKIEEQDTVMVNAGGPNAGAGAGGGAVVQRDIYAVDPNNQKRVRIAEEVTTVEEEVVNPGQGGQAPQGGQGYNPPRGTGQEGTGGNLV